MLRPETNHDYAEFQAGYPGLPPFNRAAAETAGASGLALGIDFAEQRAPRIEIVAAQ